MTARPRRSVVRAAVGAEQRPREAVGLLRPHPGHPQQLPGVGPQHLVGALAQRRGDGRGERLGGAAPGQYPPHGLHALRGGCRGRTGGPSGHRHVPADRSGLGGGAAGGGLRVGEDRRHRLGAALHGPDRGEQVGPRCR
ncbi:hypothetical protein Sdagh_14320 [Streptomyces daghestanicus]|uniref:Uncharacterized protein n=1 Tax=Streptomyces daghestanicus TaxID=66885 RepID=A0ABQ3PXJ0_9ACTN|nr:hypothetical protein Sdagh_14320 [Streptomyces daghestanicus]